MYESILFSPHWAVSNTEDHTFGERRKTNSFCHEMTQFREESRQNRELLVNALLSPFTPASPYPDIMFNVHLSPCPDYLREHPRANRLKIITQVAEGLNYLHEKCIVHGDIKAANIVVSEDGCPVLTDFGISGSTALELNGDPEEVGNLRYMAPELVLYAKEPTEASDVYSWASTCYEILTKVVPFDTAMCYADIILAFYDGQLPYDGMRKLLNDGLNDRGIWDLMITCWMTDPGARPQMQAVLQMLQKFLKLYEGKLAHL